MLAIIIVNYKNEEQTISFIHKELSQVSLPNMVIVVNNEATTESDAVLVKELQAELITDISRYSTSKKIFIVSHPVNLGYAKGNNLGVEFAVKHFDIEYFVFSNNDIRFIEDETIERLVAKFKELPSSVAAIGPAILGLNGEKQSPIIYLSFFTKWVLGRWYTPFLSKKQRINFYKIDFENITEGRYYTLMGSFLLVKAKIFLACGMFDPNTFLFGEEAILAERLARVNKTMYYYPQVTILHEHSVTINKYNNHIKKIRMMFDSDIYYYKTYKSISTFNIVFCWMMVNFHYVLWNMKEKLK